METRFKNIFIGSILAIVCASTLIFAMEEQKSFYQIAAGFLLFIFPFTFISIFSSKFSSFLFVFITIIIGYIVSKYYYNDFWIGVILAILIGGALYIFLTIPIIKKINNYKPFNPNNYKEKVRKHNNKK